MIVIKSDHEIKAMRLAGAIAAEALAAAGRAVKPGATTLQIDRVVREVISKHNAKPSFLGYGGFPAAACVSLNEQVIHGIPGDRVIAEGDLVKVDVGAFYQGFHGDTAATFAAGGATPEAERLIAVTRQSFYEGIRFAREGARIGDVSHAVQACCEKAGYSVVRSFVGHGVGEKLHEEPEVPNYGEAGHGVRLRAGMTIAVEPMVNIGTPEVRTLKDRWTVVTADGSLSAHYEHTVLITEGEPELLTFRDE